MRPDELYLTDILEASLAINRFLLGVTQASFLNNEVLQSAVLQKLTVIGEAAARLSASFKMTHAHIPWKRVSGFRNFIVHEYFSVDFEIVWATATESVPVLAAQISATQNDTPSP